MWVIAEYQPTALFSLKPATATASGGKTLLVPTPYAVKMALLDIVCRLAGQEVGAAIWDAWLNNVSIALRPAENVVVNNTFIKILKPRRNPADPGTQDAGYFQKTIAYREYAQLAGTLGIAVEVADDNQAADVTRWLLNINYLGKRGSFMQVKEVPTTVDTLPNGYVHVSKPLEGFPLDVVLTQLDDTGDGATFDVVNIYSGKRMTMGKQRVLNHVALPYQRVSSSRGYTHYRYRAPKETP